MYTAHTFPRSFKDKRLSSYFQSISLQFEAGPEPYPEDTDGSVTPAEGSWQENATPPGTQPQIFALNNIDSGTCYFFVPLNRLLHRLYVRSAGRKDSNNIGVHRDRSDTASKKDSTQGHICRPIPKPKEQGLQSKDIEKRRQGKPCRTDC